MAGAMNKSEQLAVFERMLRENISKISEKPKPLERGEQVGEPYDSLVMATREIKHLKSCVDDLAKLLMDTVSIMRGGIKNESAPKR